MKKVTYILILTLSCLVFNSCLKSNLDDLPAFEEAEITDFQFEYRWISEGRLWTQQLNNSISIDSNNGTVTNVLTIPESTGQFTETIRADVSIGTIAAYASLSTAATMMPLGDAPKMGVPGYTATAQYEVTAADGKTKRTWTVNTTIE